MKQIIPAEVYQGLPCSAVAVGCALGYDSRVKIATGGCISPDLHSDGYLSLKGMNALIRANMGVKKRVNYKKGERPELREWAHAEGKGKRAVVCLLGHFIYFDGRDYYSFFWNNEDDVVAVWYLE